MCITLGIKQWVNFFSDLVGEDSNGFMVKTWHLHSISLD